MTSCHNSLCQFDLISNSFVKRNVKFRLVERNLFTFTDFFHCPSEYAIDIRSINE